MRLALLLSGVLVSTVMMAADNTSLLSLENQEQLRIQKQQNELSSDNLRNDWLNPVTGAWSWTKTEGLYGADDKGLGAFSISIDQPIFRSGGIYFGIRYADANRAFLRLTTKSSEQSQIKQVMNDVLRIRRLELQIERLGYQIENAKIDIIRKREHYENGFADSSDLDQAILNKSTLEHSLLDLKSSKTTLVKDFESISSGSIESLHLPTFVMMDEEKYLDQSLTLKQQVASLDKAQWLQRATVSNSLLNVSLNAAYYSRKIDYSSSSDVEDDYKTYGIKFSIPLIDVNRRRNIELARLDTLMESSELQELKRSEKKLYESAYENVNLLEKKRELSKIDYELYSSLLYSTEELAGAGEKTQYDVDTLKNSRETMRIDQGLYAIDIQLALLDLYAKMHGEI